MMILVIDDGGNLFLVDKITETLVRELDAGDVKAVKLGDLTESQALGDGQVNWTPIHRMAERPENVTGNDSAGHPAAADTASPA